MNNEHELIFVIINAGYSDMVMEAAKNQGARGGTIINARGTANKEAEKLFNIPIHEDKEIVMIIVASNIKENVLHAIYQNAGFKSDAQGIAFSLPVSNVVGLNENIKQK